MQHLPIANRERELEFLAGMVAGTTPERILLLDAGGGMGKTTLMTEFVRHCHGAGMPCVPVDLKGGPGPHAVLARLCDGLGRDGFPTLAARVEELGRGGEQAASAARFEHVRRERYNRGAIRAFMVEAFSIDDLRALCFDRPVFEPALALFAKGISLPTLAMDLIMWCERHHGALDNLLVALREERFEQYKRHYARIYGMETEAALERPPARAAGTGIGESQIRDALRTADEGDRVARLGALTRALFDDLGSRPGRLAILFDTYEQAAPEVEKWLAGPFLAHAHRLESLIVVVAGRRVPEPSLEWEACCQHHRLGELRDPALWQAYAEQIGADLPSPEFIPVFCQHFDGHPLQMMTALQPYIRSGGGQ